MYDFFSNVTDRTRARLCSGRRGCSLLIVASLAAMGTPSRLTAATFLYVANERSNSVSAYSVSATTGALTPVPGGPFAVGSGPLSVAIDPIGRFLYTANRVSNDVSAFSIDASTGALTPVPGSPFAAGSSAYAVTVHTSGRFLYVANEGSNNVSAYAIDGATGALNPVVGSPFAEAIVVRICS